MSTIAAALAALDPRVKVTRGTPAAAEDVAALERHAGVALPADYRAFLLEFGAIQLECDQPGMYGDLRFLGHAPGNGALDAKLACDALPDEFERWHREPEPALPVLVWGVNHGGGGSPGSECRVVARGRLCSFWRGRIEKGEETFEALFTGWTSEIAKRFAEGERVREKAQSSELVAALRTIVPAALVDASESDPARLVITRPRDGAKVAISTAECDEGREEWTFAYATWNEPAARTGEELNAYNARALFVRAWSEGDGCRFAGRLVADGLEPARFWYALARDAELGVPVEPPTMPTIDQLDRALSEVDAASRRRSARIGAAMHAKAADLSPEERAALRAKVEAMPAPDRYGRREGDAIGGPSILAVSGFRWVHEPIDVRFAVGPAGLVEVQCRRRLAVPREDAFFVVQRAHAEGLRYAATSAVRLSIEGEEAVATVVLPLAGLRTDALAQELAGLAQDVEASGIFDAGDEDAQRGATIGRALGLPVGRFGSALFAALERNALGLFATLDFGVTRGRPATRLGTPWGAVAIWGSAYEPVSAVDRYVPSRRVELGLAVERGSSTDDCPVVAIREDEAVVVAPDLRSFASVLVLGTTGIDFDGDDESLWRSFRGEMGHSPWDLPKREAFCEALGIEPATEVRRIVEAAPEPRRGSAER